MKQKKWDKSINQLETEIKELSQKQKNLTKRLRNLKRLMSGKNIYIIKGEKQNRLKILWMGKDFWFHLPKPKGDDGVVDDGLVSKIKLKFIDEILSGKI